MGEIPKHNERAVLQPETSKPEYIAEGFRPIMACVGSAEHYGDEIEKLKDIETHSHDVDYYSDEKTLKETGYKNAGHQSYVISPIDERPKFTKKLANCTTLIAVGRENGTEKELSFLTHQDPDKFLWFKKELFIKHLKEQLEGLKKECAEGSIDIVIAGGNVREESLNEYRKSLELLSSVVQEECGFEPLVISGPKEEGGLDDVYFDTQTRRAYIVRPNPEKAPHFNEPFKPSSIGEKTEKWQEQKKNIINPDGFKSWKDLGFKKAPKGFKNVDEYLESDPEQERGAEDQVSLLIIDEFLEDLSKMED